MKNALLSYSSPLGMEWANNIGDYIQGLAANQFMHTDTYLDRECLDEFSGETTKVIMNGWFMYDPKRFPPSEKINPLFVSFHIRPSIAERLLTANVISYLKRYEPIGCRDLSTLRILESHGVRAYFSACLTLTLGRTYHRPDAEHVSGVCFVDPFIPIKLKDSLRGLHWFVLRPHLAMSVYRSIRCSILAGQPFRYRLKHVVRIGAFLRCYTKMFSRETIESAEYLSSVVNASRFDGHRELFAYAEKLLQKFMHKRLCVTSRIHCALPCVGMGVPVIFVDAANGNLSDGRFDGLLQFFNLAHVTSKGLVPSFEWRTARADGLIDETAEIPIGAKHLDYVEKLVKKCELFAAE